MFHHYRAPRINSRGFTLIELLVTMVVTGIMVAGITELYVIIEQTQQQSERLESATRAAQAEIESLRNLRYGSLTAGSTIDFTAQLPSGLPSPRSGTVAISEPTQDIKRVDVTIDYHDSGGTKTVKLSSLIGVLGIGQ